jgi:IS1 family transposase
LTFLRPFQFSISHHLRDEQERLSEPPISAVLGDLVFSLTYYEKDIDSLYFPYYDKSRDKNMANILPFEKQIVVIHALAEGNSIRSIERMTGINRNTIMSLGLRVGAACETLLDTKMRDLTLSNIQVDEIWGFVGKKQKNVRRKDSRELGDVWTWIALDRNTKLIPSYIVGKRDAYHANAFMYDLSSRVKNRPQISSDALHAYAAAVERGFGANVDYGQIVKTFASDESVPQGKYSPAEVVSVEKTAIMGNPAQTDICTSHVEKQNHTLRMHCRRLTRLTNAFSKKLDNFKAAVALNFAYYNFVKIHGSIRCTPAMAAGVSPNIWNVADLVELAK